MHLSSKSNDGFEVVLRSQKWKAAVIPYTLAFEKFLLMAPKKMLTISLACCSHRLATCGNL